MKDITYRLVTPEKCNMCHSPVSESKMLGRRLNSSQGLSPKKKPGFSVSVMRCNNCGLIYPSPLPIPSSIDDHYGVPPESYWTDAFLTVEDDYYSGNIRLIEKTLDIKEGMKALDIGAGIGKCMVALERRGFETYGIEPSSTFYQRTQENFNFSPEKFHQESIESAEFENEMFDFITFGAVLEHLYDPFGSIEKALRWTKKGGVIAIEVPNSDWLIAKLINKVYKIKGSDFVANISPMHEPFHIFEFTKKTFEEAAKLLNYEIALLEYFPGQTYGPGPIKKLLKPMVKGEKAMQLYVILRKL